MNKQRNYRENWWLHANRAENVAPYLQTHGRIIAITSVSKHLCVAFVRRGTIAANTLLLILLYTDGDFAVMQSRIHEEWARFTGSSMKDDLRYTTPCFDTFPRPGVTAAVESAGRIYYEFRADLMVRHDEGLTKTYNRFHDPDERDAKIIKLRDLHAAMDRAVLEAYGWYDLAERADCEFRLDYEDPDEGEDEGVARNKKKKPWRYKWSQDFHDEILARLLELNAIRAEQERLADQAMAPTKVSKQHSAGTIDESEFGSLFAGKMRGIRGGG